MSVTPLLRLVRYVTDDEADHHDLAIRVATEIEEAHKERVRVLRSIMRHQRRELARLRAELRRRLR